LKNDVSGDDEDDSEQSRYRDSLERADFAEKLCRFERLTSAAAVADRGPSSRPSSAPLTSAAGHGSPADRLRHSISDSAPAVTFPASSRGWTRRGHRVGVVETPTGDVDLDAVSPSSPRLEPAVTVRRTDELNRDVVSPSGHSWRLREDTSSSPLQTKSLHPSTKRHTGRDRLSDVRAAILASAAAKLSSATERVSSARSNNISPDCLRAVKSSTASGTGPEDLQRPGSVECKTAIGLTGVESGTDTCSDDSSQLLKQPDEQTSESAHSSSSGRTENSPTAQKPPTGRTSVESARSTKQTDRRNFDKASSFFRSLLTRSRSPSPNRTNVHSCQTAGKSARPNDLQLNGSWTQDRHSPGGDGKTPDSTVLVSPQSSPCYSSVTPSESAEKSLDSSESFEHNKSPGTDLLYAANNHKSYSEHSKPLTECSKSENSTSYSSDSEKIFTRDTVTTKIVIGKNTARVESASPSTHSRPLPVGEDVDSSNQRLRSTTELVINSAADSKPETKRSEQQLSVDASPNQSTKVRKVVTFAGERNGGMSSVPLGSCSVESRSAVNREMQVEAEQPTNNNPVMVSRLTTSESVQMNSAHGDDAPQSDIAFDVSNANTLQSDNEGTTATVGSNNIASNIGQDPLQSTASAWRTDACKSTATVNGHESDDSASISDLESEDLSASQQDLRTLYQQRRAERLQEQKAAELEKQRLEEILKLCTEFGLSSDISSSLLVGEDGSNAKAERQNSVGRIKTNGSLTMLAGLPSAESSSVLERRLNQSGSGSNSDDDVDRGTIRRRPVTTKNLVDSSASATASKTTLPMTKASDHTASDNGKALRTTLARTSSGTLPTAGLPVEAAGRSKSVPMIDTNMTLVDGELERLLQSNIDFSLPTAADWRVGQNSHPGILKSSSDWYSASLPEYSSIWDSINTWKSSQHRVSTRCHVIVLNWIVDFLSLA